MADYHCEECGKYGYGEPAGGPAGGSRSPKGWVQNKIFGWGIKYYCSNRCKKLAEGVSSSSTAGANQSQVTRNNIETPIQKSAEQIRAEHEAQMELRSIRREEEAQEKAERKLKAQIFKDKGWLFIAWIIESNPIYPICLFGYPFLFLMGPGLIPLIGLISIFILAMLLIKDVSKISWKGFVIILLLGLGLFTGYILFFTGSGDDFINEEDTQIESNLNDTINKNNLEIEKAESNNVSESDEYTEIQDYITIVGIADKIYFYDQPDLDSKTKGFFVKGQKAILLGESKQFSKVRFEYNDRVTEKFVLTNDISQIVENTQNETSDNPNLIGDWKGKFGNDQLLLTIETINTDGSVTGFDIVKGNRRALIGTATKSGDVYNFELEEPGDDEWDGVYKFSISGNTAKGNWTANNGKSTKQFSLTK